MCGIIAAAVYVTMPSVFALIVVLCVAVAASATTGDEPESMPVKKFYSWHSPGAGLNRPVCVLTPHCHIFAPLVFPQQKFNSNLAENDFITQRYPVLKRSNRRIKRPRGANVMRRTHMHIRSQNETNTPHPRMWTGPITRAVHLGEHNICILGVPTNSRATSEQVELCCAHSPTRVSRNHVLLVTLFHLFMSNFLSILHTGFSHDFPVKGQHCTSNLDFV
jgi:hypothetical protein